MKDREVKKAAKINIETIIFPTVTYGSEISAMRNKERRRRRKRIDAFELWRWRRILQVPWTDRRTNVSVLEEVQHKRPLEATILRLKLRYFDSESVIGTGHYAWDSCRTQEARKTTDALA
jgi:hypothetical protein